MISAGRCETGNCRQNNEDAIFIHDTMFGPLPNLYIVADGMGGHQAGEVASMTAIQSFCMYIHENREKEIRSEIDILEILKEGILYSNRMIFQKSLEQEELAGMGTTFLVATIYQGRLYVANVGDSRLYVLKDSDIKRITVDHSYVEELIRTGKLSEKEAENHPKRNVITRAVGTQEFLTVDTYGVDLEDYTMILMCSDGLTTMLSDAEIAEICSRDGIIEEKAQKLLDQANARGGLDNISIILLVRTETEVNQCCSQE